MPIQKAFLGTLSHWCVNLLLCRLTCLLPGSRLPMPSAAEAADWPPSHMSMARSGYCTAACIALL